MLLAVLVLFLVMWNVVWRWKNRKCLALAKQLAPRYIALPLVGHAYRFLGNGEDRMNTFKNISQESIEKGGLISHWQGSKLYILVSEPVAAEHLLKTCLEKDDSLRFFRSLIQNGSIFAPVSVWRPRRKILAPTFSPKNLDTFVKVFSRQSSILADQLRSVVGTGAFSVWKYVTTYTMDSVCETTLGIQMNSQLQSEQPFLQAFENCCRIDSKRIVQPWLHNDILYRYSCNKEYQLHTHSKDLIWSFMDQIIKSKLDALKMENPKTNKEPKHGLKTFLELLMGTSSGDKGYDNVELREETLVLVLAGTDTSAVGAAFTLLMLAKHPNVQDKVYKELKELFGESERAVTAEDLPHLKDLDAVIKETLRLFPPVPFIARKVEDDISLPSGVTLVKGCGLLISIWAIHRNPQYWGDDAEQFRPERFWDAPLKHPAAYMPFSHGPRACLGYQYAMMSMKTALATILLRYRVLPSDATDTASELRVSFDVMMKDVNNFKLQLDLRT